jgi:hypothetical protein
LEANDVSVGYGKIYRLYTHLQLMGLPINTIVEAFKPENICFTEKDLTEKLQETSPPEIIIWDDAPYWKIYTPRETWAWLGWSFFIKHLYGDEEFE